MTPTLDSLGDLEWLARWYRERCDGVWEHRYGITIETLDNPGWEVTIDVLPGASEEARVLLTDGEPPSAANGNVGGSEWLICEYKSGRFIGAGDPFKLPAIIQHFREFIQTQVAPGDDTGGS